MSGSKVTVNFNCKILTGNAFKLKHKLVNSNSKLTLKCSFCFLELETFQSVKGTLDLSLFLASD